MHGALGKGRCYDAVDNQAFSSDDPVQSNSAQDSMSPTEHAHEQGLLLAWAGNILGCWMGKQQHLIKIKPLARAGLCEKGDTYVYDEIYHEGWYGELGGGQTEFWGLGGR